MTEGERKLDLRTLHYRSGNSKINGSIPPVKMNTACVQVTKELIFYCLWYRYLYDIFFDIYCISIRGGQFPFIWGKIDIWGLNLANIGKKIMF